MPFADFLLTVDNGPFSVPALPQFVIGVSLSYSRTGNGVVFCELVTVGVVDDEQRHVERVEMVSVAAAAGDLLVVTAVTITATVVDDDDDDEFFVNDLLLIDFLLL